MPQASSDQRVMPVLTVRTVLQVLMVLLVITVRRVLVELAVTLVLQAKILPTAWVTWSQVASKVTKALRVLEAFQV